MVKKFLKIVFAIPLTLLTPHTVIRIGRYFHKFPIPQWMANVVDNPLRRKIQRPDETAIRHDIKPGMSVLEVGPGIGAYALAVVQRI